MVIGERFAWAHLPKTGGSATLELFRLFPEADRVRRPRRIEREARAVHGAPRGGDRGQALAMNFRRLPFWVLSRAQHVARWGIHPDYKPIPMASPRSSSESDFPDSRIALYTDDGRLGIDQLAPDGAPRRGFPRFRLRATRRDRRAARAGVSAPSDGERARVRPRARRAGSRAGPDRAHVRATTRSGRRSRSALYGDLLETAPAGGAELTTRAAATGRRLATVRRDPGKET